MLTSPAIFFFQTVNYELGCKPAKFQGCSYNQSKDLILTHFNSFLTHQKPGPNRVKIWILPFLGLVDDDDVVSLLAFLTLDGNKDLKASLYVFKPVITLLRCWRFFS